MSFTTVHIRYSALLINSSIDQSIKQVKVKAP